MASALGSVQNNKENLVFGSSLFMTPQKCAQSAPPTAASSPQSPGRALSPMALSPTIARPKSETVTASIPFGQFAMPTSAASIMPPPFSLSSSFSSMGPPSMGPPSMGPPSMGPPSMGPPSMGPPGAKRNSSIFEAVSRGQTASASATPSSFRNSRTIVRRNIKEEEESSLNERKREDRKSSALSKQASNRNLSIHLSRQKSEQDTRNEIAEQQKKDLFERDKKRIEAVREVLTSENNYINHLNTIVDTYLVPLRRDYSAPEEVKFIVSIFSNIEAIREANRGLFSLLQQRLGSGCLIEPNVTLSDIFFQIMPALDAYTHYYVNWYRSLHYLDLWMGRCKKFKKFIDDKTTTLPLKSLLIMPCQRIPRYTLLIDAVLRFTDPIHIDFSPLQAALTQMKKLTESINEKVRDSEKLQLVTNVRLKFDDSIGFLDEIHRRLIKESAEFQLLPCKNINQIHSHYNVNNNDEDLTDEEDYSTNGDAKKKKKGKNLVPSDCQLYLFNDLFVIGVQQQQNGSHSAGQTTGKLTKLLKATLATTIFKEYPTLPNKFSVHHNSGTYIFSATTKDAKELFVKEANEAIALLLATDPEMNALRANLRVEGSDETGWTVFDPSVSDSYPLAKQALEELAQMTTQIHTPKKRKSVVGKLRDRTRSFLSPHKSAQSMRRSSSFHLNTFDGAQQ
eukprot:gene11602-13544_t